MPAARLAIPRSIGAVRSGLGDGLTVVLGPNESGKTTFGALTAPTSVAVDPARGGAWAADDRFGEETYYVKVDTSLPERAPRRWEERSR